MTSEQASTDKTDNQPEESQATISPDSIKKLREQLDLQQDEMAELLDVSVGTIHRWETGKAEPRERRKRQLRVLKAKVEEFGGETVSSGINAWLTFAPRMMGGLAGASIEMLLENSFSRWIDILQKSATKMITQSDGQGADRTNSQEDGSIK